MTKQNAKRNKRLRKKLHSGEFTQWCYHVELSSVLTEQQIDDLYFIAESRGVWLATFQMDNNTRLLFHNNYLLSDVMIFEKILLKNYLNSIAVVMDNVIITDSDGERVIRENSYDLYK